MADLADLAEDKIEMARQAAIQNVLDRLKPGGVLVMKGNVAVCCDCGESIPLGRLKSCPNCTRCVDCQSALEKEEKLYA